MVAVIINPIHRLYHTVHSVQYTAGKISIANESLMSATITFEITFTICIIIGYIFLWTFFIASLIKAIEFPITEIIYLPFI